MRFIIVGDICHPGRIDVEADTLDEALDKAEAGQFVVHDKQDDCLAFTWNGDVDTIERHEEGQE